MKKGLTGLFFLVFVLGGCSSNRETAQIPSTVSSPAITGPIFTPSFTPTVTMIPLSKDTITPYKIPTNTPLPTFTRTKTPLPPTVTSSPVPTLTRHIWRPEVVLAKLDSWGGDGCCVYPNPPRLVLYADRRIIIKDSIKENGGYYRSRLLSKVLSREEMCAFLNTIDQAGFFDYDPATYKPQGSEYFSVSGAGYTSIDVNAWRTTSGKFFGLFTYTYEWDLDNLVSTDAAIGAPPVPPALKNTFYFLNSYMPEGMTIYIPEKVGIAVDFLEDINPGEGDQTEEWPFPELNLEEIARETNLVGGQPFYIVNGNLARSVYNYFDQFLSDGHRVKQNNRAYVIFERPILPYEIPRSDGFNILPDPNVERPDIKLKCYPFDGTIPIPTPSFQ